jgi:hypothetical protein
MIIGGSDHFKTMKVCINVPIYYFTVLCVILIGSQAFAKLCTDRPFLTPLAIIHKSLYYISLQGQLNPRYDAKAWLSVGNCKMVYLQLLAPS